MDDPKQVRCAIAVHGCQLSDNGTITHALKVRLDTAVKLYLEGRASIIIVCGWRPLKREDLAKYCESEVMERYLRETYGNEPWFSKLTIMRESDSTSVPENLVFVRHRFPNLRHVTIVVGENVVERIRFFGQKIFGDSAKVLCVGCNDGVGNKAGERKLIGDASCTLKEMASGDLGFLLLPPGSDGRLRSRWDELRIAHHDCEFYGGLHPNL